MILPDLVSPFADFAFMRRALAACLILSVSATPLGIFMMLRRMTLVGDAVSHAILPGIALAFLLAGLNIWGMTLGGIATGVTVALAAVLLSRYTQLEEDSSFTLVYLLSLSTGIVLVSLHGSSVDLMHLLFGNILGIDNDALLLIAAVGCLTTFALAASYRSLILDCFDPDFLRASGRGRYTGQVFFVLLVVNLVAAFQALGTVMALGLMILPALASRFWTRSIDRMLPLSIGIAAIASLAGLLVSYQIQLPTGPAIVLVAGGIALLSALAGTHGSVRCYRRP